MSRSARLCWGQRYHWLRYQHMPAGSRHEAHITDGFPLPEGVSSAQVRSALTYLVRRHEGLRTVYDARGWQVVQPPAPLPLPDVTTESDGTPSPAEVIDTLDTDFDPHRDWPLRGCVVTTGGVPKRLHMVFNHLAFDDVSLARLRAEFQAVLTGMLTGRPAVLPPVRRQPVDVAVAEAARPRESVEAALDHWRTEATRLPADVFATRRDPGRRSGAAHSASLTSPWLLAAAQDIAGRARVWPAAVHLAAYAVTAAAYTGQPVISNRIYTSQREAGGDGPVMTCMSFPAPVSVQVGDDPTFSEVLGRAAGQIEQALANAHVPYDELVELVSREGTRRGRPVRVASELNFLNNAPRSCGTRRDRFTRNPAPADWVHSGSDTYLRVYEWSDGVTLMLQATAEVMDADAVERFLHGYLALLDAHRNPAVDLRVSEAAARFGGAAPRRPVVWVDADPVDVAATGSALRAHDAVESVQLALDTRGLVAHVTASAPVTPARLRAHLLDVAYDHPAVRCPDWFQIVPTAGDDDTPWSAVDGDGREHPPLHPGDAAQRALATAVAEANELGDGDEVDLAASYCGAGARALAMPTVLAALRERGWRGVDQGHLASTRPLEALARRLERV